MIQGMVATSMAIRAFVKCHPNGVSTGQVRHQVGLAAKRTADEVRAYLESLAAAGLAEIEDVPAGGRSGSGVTTIPMRVYKPTAALLAMKEIDR